MVDEFMVFNQNHKILKHFNTFDTIGKRDSFVDALFFFFFFVWFILKMFIFGESQLPKVTAHIMVNVTMVCVGVCVCVCMCVCNSK